MRHACPLEYLTPELGHCDSSFQDDYNGFPTSDLEPPLPLPLCSTARRIFLNLTCLASFSGSQDPQDKAPIL